MVYVALEKRSGGVFEPEIEPKETSIKASGNDLEILGWIDENQRIFVYVGIDELPEDFRRRIVEYEVKKAAELLNMISNLIEGEEGGEE